MATFSTGSGAPRAVLWTHGSMIDLNTLLPASAISAGWSLYQANGINDDGTIVGWARNSISGGDAAFVMRLIPEASTYAWMASGLLALGMAGRRRGR